MAVCTVWAERGLRVRLSKTPENRIVSCGKCKKNPKNYGLEKSRVPQ